MEHDDRAPIATFLADAAIASAAMVTLGEAASHHARVKRLEVGDVVRVTDGAGRVAAGAIAAMRRGELVIQLGDVATVAPPSPIHLRVPIGDRDRMLWLAEKATELGIATWQAVRFRRSLSVTPRGEGPAFAEKIRARMTSALEQSGGAWMPTMLPDTTPDTLSFEAGEIPLLLDAGGEPLASISDSGRAPVILFGPEGGLDASELKALVAAGWRRASLSATTLRFETAGIAAVAVLRSAMIAADRAHAQMLEES